MKNQNKLIWLVPAVMLFLCFLPFPYGYFTLLRIIVTAAACYIVFLEYREHKTISFSAIIFGFIAIIFNPLIHFHFHRSFWNFIDLVAGVAFLCHMAMTQFDTKRKLEANEDDKKVT